MEDRYFGRSNVLDTHGSAARDMAEGSSSHVSMETGNYRIYTYWQNRIRPISHKK